MPRLGEPRVVVRLSQADRDQLQRWSAQADVAVAALLREVTLTFAPAWLANRAVGEVAPVRRRNRPRAVRPWVEPR
jgi:hypothetical protein